MASYETRTRRFSRAEYERLIDLGVFRPGEAIELIGGQLMVAEPQGAAHYTAIRKTARALEAAFGPWWEVRTEGPIALDEDSEPEPDVVVVAGGPDDYGRAHPSRPALTVEVAESNLGVDRRHKGSLYARAGLSDYWVLNLVDRVLEVFRGPAPIPRRRSGGVTLAARCSTPSRGLPRWRRRDRVSPSRISYPDQGHPCRWTPCMRSVP
jgi:Uma2 family endonuclease